jgi:adenylate cyclase
MIVTPGVSSGTQNAVRPCAPRLGSVDAHTVAFPWVAGDLLLDVTQELLKREKLTPSAVAFLFDDDDRILAHPRMSELLGREVSGTIPRLRATDMAGVLEAIRAWRADGISEQLFRDSAGRRYAAAFQTIPHSGPANLRVAVVAPVDEFFASILSERGKLFALALGFVAAMVPVVFMIGSMQSRALRALAEETDRIQRFQPSNAPQVQSMIQIDELGRSVSMMRTGHPYLRFCRGGWSSG